MASRNFQMGNDRTYVCALDATHRCSKAAVFCQNRFSRRNTGASDTRIWTRMANVQSLMIPQATCACVALRLSGEMFYTCPHSLLTLCSPQKTALPSVGTSTAGSNKSPEHAARRTQPHNRNYYTISESVCCRAVHSPQQITTSSFINTLRPLVIVGSPKLVGKLVLIVGRHTLWTWLLKGFLIM